MNIFPTKEQKFKLINNQVETLERLNSRTDKSKNLTTQFTDKSFRGIINGNEFKIISSEMRKGAFCVMTGKIDAQSGNVKVQIHRAFRILISVFFCILIIGMTILAFTETKLLSPILIFQMIGLVLMIRYVFVGLVFKFLSKDSLNRFHDVLDIEWIKN